MVHPLPVTQMPNHSPEHAPSWYAASANRALEFPALEGETVADVCIIGGGYTGLNCAIELARRGYRVVLLEARLIGWGASGRNGGQLIRGVGHDVERFRLLLGADGVRRLKLYGLEAVELVRRRVEEFAIDCDLRWGYCDLANRPQHLQD
ncbi:MAG TPA: FAD-binding oxidoreductase, partial [Pseudomonas sp.]